MSAFLNFWGFFCVRKLYFLAQIIFNSTHGVLKLTNFNLKSRLFAKISFKARFCQILSINIIWHLSNARWRHSSRCASLTVWLTGSTCQSDVILREASWTVSQARFHLIAVSWVFGECRHPPTQYLLKAIIVMWTKTGSSASIKSAALIRFIPLEFRQKIAESTGLTCRSVISKQVLLLRNKATFTALL